MSPGVSRILPFALISTALHAVVLVSVPERLDFAVTPDGNAGAVSVRLVPSGPATPEPAEQPGTHRAKQPESRPSAARETPDREAQPTRTAQVQPTEQASASPDTAASPEPKGQAEAAPRSEPQSAPDPEPKRSSKSRSEPSASARAENEPDSKAPRKDRADGSNQPSADTPDTGNRDTRTPEEPRTAQANPADRSPARAASGAEGRARRAQLAKRAREEVTVRFRGRFHYPRIARRRGWEGRVVLRLRVHRDGRISDVEVVDSSGRAVLDEAARQTLLHIQRIPELSGRAIGEPLELRFPVTYRLQPA